MGVCRDGRHDASEENRMTRMATTLFIAGGMLLGATGPAAADGESAAGVHASGGAGPVADVSARGVRTSTGTGPIDDAVDRGDTAPRRQGDHGTAR
jgi:hypothetical protein